MLNFIAMRRLLSFGVILSLLGLGPAPLSLCAQATSKLTECTDANSASQCERMGGSTENDLLNRAPDASCCYLGNPPIPQSQYKSTDLSSSAKPADFLEALRILPQLEEGPSTRIVQDLSPPPLQSFLCTFLI